MIFTPSLNQILNFWIGWRHRTIWRRTALWWSSWLFLVNSSSGFSLLLQCLSFCQRWFGSNLFYNCPSLAGGSSWIHGRPDRGQDSGQGAPVLRSPQHCHRVHWPCHFPCHQSWERLEREVGKPQSKSNEWYSSAQVYTICSWFGKNQTLSHFVEYSVGISWICLGSQWRTWCSTWWSRTFSQHLSRGFKHHKQSALITRSARRWISPQSTMRLRLKANL